MTGFKPRLVAEDGFGGDGFDPAAAAATPVIRLFELLACAIGTTGLKPTATGNLPRVLVRDVAAAVDDDSFLTMRDYIGGINHEMDFFLLHVARVTAELAGLIRKYRGRFILGRECRERMSCNGPAIVYPDLLASYVYRLNWDYVSRKADSFAPVQAAACFSMSLVASRRIRPTTALWCADEFIMAFPDAANGIRPTEHFSAECLLRWEYIHRTFRLFTPFFGLAGLSGTTISPAIDGSTPWDDMSVCPGPMLDFAITHCAGPKPVLRIM